MKCDECHDDLLVDSEDGVISLFWNLLLIPPLVIAAGVLTIVWWVWRPVDYLMRRT